jgi:hypothetical protein
MISLLIFIVIVIIVMALLIYAIQLLPLSSPPWIKQILMVLVVIIAVLVIVQKAGIAANAQTQPTPTPILKKTGPGVGYGATVPQQPRQRPPITGYQRFQGATLCVQQGNTLNCNNGLTQTWR